MVQRIRTDSGTKDRPKTRSELQKENEALKKEVDTLNEQLTDAQMALVELYEMIGGMTDG